MTLEGGSSAASSSRPSHASTATSPSWQTTPSSLFSNRDLKSPAVSSPPTSRFKSQLSPYFTAAHRTLLWPCIYSHVTRVIPEAAQRLAALAEGGTAWLIAQELDDSQSGLPMITNLSSVPVNENDLIPSFATRVYFTDLTTDRVQIYTSAYFSTFNAVYPIIDESLFMSQTLPTQMNNGFGYGDAPSVLTLLVLALGQLAVESLNEAPIATVDGEPSGICGGSVTTPPGLELFNEARARIASFKLIPDAISVQVLILQATYFEANACHVEYWRSIVEASMISCALSRGPRMQWTMLSGDLIKRAFWTCVLDEDFYHIDLDLPRTTISELVGTVSMPSFQRASWQSRSQRSEDDQSLYQFYFLSKIGLQRVITNIHDAVQHCKSIS